MIAPPISKAYCDLFGLKIGDSGAKVPRQSLEVKCKGSRVCASLETLNSGGGRLIESPCFAGKVVNLYSVWMSLRDGCSHAKRQLRCQPQSAEVSPQVFPSPSWHSELLYIAALLIICFPVSATLWTFNNITGGVTGKCIAFAPVATV